MRALTSFILAVVVSWPTLARANPVDDLDNELEGHRDKTMYEVIPLGPREGVDPALARRDLELIDSMSRHHAGAQAMARDYLADPRGTNVVLRKLSSAMITNQGFEIAVLARARESVVKPPRISDSGLGRVGIRELGVDGLEHRWRFIPWPTPTRLELALLPNSGTSDYDVAWAKGMTLHHRAAMDMARKYNGDPQGQNRVLRLLNLGIISDQYYEIGFMDKVVANYPGDAAAVQPIMPMGMSMDASGGGGMGGGQGGMGGGQGGMPSMPGV